MYFITFHGLSLSSHGLVSALTRSTISGVVKFLITQQPCIRIALMILSGSEASTLESVGIAKGIVMIDAGNGDDEIAGDGKQKEMMKQTTVGESYRSRRGYCISML